MNRLRTRSHLKSPDQVRGQGEDPELVVGGAGRSAYVKTSARQVRRGSKSFRLRQDFGGQDGGTSEKVEHTRQYVSPPKGGKPTCNPAVGGTIGP
jgi:hypothetical protein